MHVKLVVESRACSDCGARALLVPQEAGAVVIFVWGGRMKEPWVQEVPAAQLEGMHRVGAAVMPGPCVCGGSMR